ncbi:hypothetical protein ACFQL1_18255 [Halomicroarcula sp. GCM10025709]|uniref:hypothetical protein n=1 Tax=Halomicroarcula sp. GCM10025709 TaxID=3252669 RepID=UPI003616AA22
MYTAGDALPIDEVEPGSTLLLVGPPMIGKRALAARLLAAGWMPERPSPSSPPTGAPVTSEANWRTSSAAPSTGIPSVSSTVPASHTTGSCRIHSTAGSGRRRT